MKPIEHIVFDVGRLLIHWDPELIYLDRIPDPDQRAQFLSSVCNAQWNLEQDRGRDWGKGEQLLIDTHPQHENDIRAYRQNWIKSIPYAYLDVADLFGTLIESGYDVTLLTNFNQHTFIEARNKFSFLNKARGMTVSGEVQLVKPEPEIFQHHNRAWELDPQAVVFIDDSKANIDAARDAGWRTIHFAGLEGAPALQRHLHRHGVSF